MSPAAAKSEAEAVRHFLARNGSGFARGAYCERARPTRSPSSAKARPACIAASRADDRVFDLAHRKTQRAKAPVFSAHGER